MRNWTLRALLALALIPSAALVAQQPASRAPVPQTHTVMKGETLWGLAQQFLGDPHRWPAIYDLNKSFIKDPHWIYPGQVLNMPDGVATGGVTSVQVTMTPPAGAPPNDAVTPRMAPPRVAASPMNAPTVFYRESEAPTAAASRTTVEPPEPTVLMGDYIRAPYVLQTGTPDGVGHLLRSADLDPIGTAGSTTMFKAYDNVLIQPPAGTTPVAGDRFVVLSIGPAVYGQGQVVVPTGIVQVSASPSAGAATVAQVVQLFGEMKPDQMLVPLDTAGLSSTTRAVPVADGRWGTIKWVLSEPVLATTQSYVVLDVNLGDGVRPGDEFSVFRERKAGSIPSDPATPEIAIATLKAVKVTPFGTTAIVMSQVQPAIKTGARVRLTAKMP